MNIESNSRLHTAPPQIQSQSLRALSKCSLSSGSSGPSPLPWAGYSMPITLWCRPFPSPPAAPPLTQLHPFPRALSLSQRAELSVAPLLPVRSCSRHQASPQPALLWAEHIRSFSRSSYVFPFRSCTSRQPSCGRPLIALCPSHCDAQTCEQHSR